MSDDHRQGTSAPGRAGAPAECVVAHCPTQRQLRRRTRARCAARCGRAAAAAATNGAQAWQRDVRALNLPMGRPHTKAACGQSADGTPHQDASIPVRHRWNHKNRRLASVRSQTGRGLCRVLLDAKDIFVPPPRGRQKNTRQANFSSKKVIDFNIFTFERSFLCIQYVKGLAYLVAPFSE